MSDAGLGRTIYLFVESGGERVGLVATRKGTVDGGGSSRQGQTKKIPKTPRTHKLK